MRRDGEEDDAPHERRDRRRTRMGDELRAMLADVGIAIDEDEPKKIAPAPIAHEIDRDEIRRVLEQLGYPEWAIVSCPGLEYARAAKPWDQIGAQPTTGAVDD